MAGEPYVLQDGNDQARLAWYRASRPDVKIGGGDFGTWQALITEENGETVIVRHTLHDLLDRLDEVLAGPE